MMPRRVHLRGLLLASSLTLPLLGCPGRPASSAPKKTRASAPVARQAAPRLSGAELYKQSCSACHGPEARGVDRLGKDLVAGDFCRSQSDEQLLALIKQGRGTDDPLNTTNVAMPPKGGNPALSDADIQAIIGWLRSLQTRTS